MRLRIVSILLLYIPVSKKPSIQVLEYTHKNFLKTRNFLEKLLKQNGTPAISTHACEDSLMCFM